jgi:biopolymer transport protein ExbD
MKFKSGHQTNAEIDMTPMIDIVFQLISFFMLVTNFDQAEADERVKLPSDMLAKPPLVARSNELTVNIGFKRDFTGKMLDPLPYVFFGDQEYRVQDSVKFLMPERRLMEAKGNKEKLKDMTIIIRADGETQSGLIQEFMNIAQQQKFEKFSLKAMQPDNY